MSSFRVCLYRIGEQLSRQSLDHLKFMCQLTGAISVARIEQVASATDLFSALEEKGKLSSNNLEFLAQILISINQTNSLDILRNSNFKVPNPLPMPSGDYLYTECLLKIAQNLQSNEVNRLTYIINDAHLHVSPDQVFSAIQLFKMLHQRQFVTPKDLKLLHVTLNEIGRTDLTRFITDYFNKTGQPIRYSGQELQGQIMPHPGRPGDQYVHPVQESAASTPAGRTSSSSSVSSLSTLASDNTSLPSGPAGETPTLTPGMPSYASHDWGSQAPFNPQPQYGLVNPSMQMQPKIQTYLESHPQQQLQQQRNVGSTSPHAFYMETQQQQQQQQQQRSTSPLMHPAQMESLQQQQQQRSTGNISPQMGHPSYLESLQQQQQQQNMSPQMFPANFPAPHRPNENASLPPVQPEIPYTMSAVAPPKLAWLPPANEKPQPFGLLFNAFEKQPGDPSLPTPQGQKREADELLHRLGLKQGELTQKEEDIERLRAELSEAHHRTDDLLMERVGEVEVYTKSIRDLEDLLKVKNGEVQSLLFDLRNLHGKMENIQAANNALNPEELYTMSMSPHGLCIIVNNHKFHHPTDPDKAHSERGGANIDQYNLSQTFRYLRYKVEVHENLTSQQMKDLMMTTAQRDHSKYDSFICCILTHGETNMVHGADSLSVNLMDLTGIMKMSGTLVGKPKLFFIQACRGEAEDKGFEHADIQHDAPNLGVPSIPQESDFFFGYATPQGNAAYRSRRHGSWYISELCKVLTQHAYTHNLSSMMKKVNLQVSKAFTKEGYKQAPEFVDRLRKEVHFFHFSKAQKQKEEQQLERQL